MRTIKKVDILTTAATSAGIHVCFSVIVAILLELFFLFHDLGMDLRKGLLEETWGWGRFSLVYVGVGTVLAFLAIGFIAGILWAVFYNLVSMLLGGVKVHLDGEPAGEAILPSDQ